MLNVSNLCTFEGRLIADPKISQVSWNTQQGPKTATKAEFTLAIDRKMSAQQKQTAQQAGKPTADFPRFVVIGARADFVSKYLTKGKPCKVVASFETSSWTDNQGQKQYGWVFQVEDIGFTLSDSTQHQNGNQQNGGYAGGNANYNPAPQNNGGSFAPIDDSDMPF